MFIHVLILSKCLKVKEKRFVKDIHCIYALYLPYYVVQSLYYEQLKRVLICQLIKYDLNKFPFYIYLS